MKILILFLIMAQSSLAFSNIIANTFALEKITPYEKFIFYLHGGIIQAKGVDAVSPYFGKYEYTKILSKINRNRYLVISERIPKKTTTAEYAENIALQIEYLLKKGVEPQNIVVIGASMGAGIAVDVSIRVKNKLVKYAVLGVCKQSSWDYYLESYNKNEIRLYGNFLSIFEKSDSYGSCRGFIDEHKYVSSFKEIELNMNLGHGFLYRPYNEWLVPFLDWVENKSFPHAEVSPSD